MVERTAHNGLVVGSSPTMPKLFNYKYKMKLNTKKYQKIKTKEYLKKNQLVFFLNGVSKKSDDRRKTEQSLSSMGFKFFKSFNKITHTELKKLYF